MDAGLKVLREYMMTKKWRRKTNFISLIQATAEGSGAWEIVRGQFQN
jgi:hypothetical protein